MANLAVADDALRRPMLGTVAEVRALSMADAEQRQPVRLIGIVTVVGPARVYYLQDDSGGVLVVPAAGVPMPVSGARIEVTGVSDYGQLVPRVLALRCRELGRGPMPKPVRLSSDDLASGRRLSEWVEVEGVVRSADFTTVGSCVLHFDLGARVVEVVLVEGTLDECEALVDARVRARGVVAGFVNNRRQMAALYVRGNSLSDVDILRTKPAEPFALPVTPAAELRVFKPVGYSGHRVRLRGVVLGQRPNESVYVRDGELSVVVFTRQDDRFAPGDVVDIAGFSEMGPVNPRLHDAVLRRIGSGPAPVPRAVTSDQFRRGQLDGELVRFGAKLLETSGAGHETVLLLGFDDALVQARLMAPAGDMPTWKEGSVLGVTGICRVEGVRKPAAGITVTAGEVELWLRGPDDVVVTEAPPWWTTTRLLVVVAIAATVALAALGWVALLRAQVREQTVIIRDKIQKEAVSEERQRIAREFHDTLEQELAGLAVRLDALQFRVNDPGSAGIVGALQRLAHRLQDEARHFIWNLRERRWENTSLSDALADALAERHAEGGVQIEFSTEGEPRKMSGVVSHHLLRIGQEAVANAVQHAGAAHVRMKLRFGTDEVILSVVDDGRGFDVAQATERRAGHFGIIGVRERARRIGAKLEFRSEAGRGTTVAVCVPAAVSSTPHA